MKIRLLVAGLALAALPCCATFSGWFGGGKSSSATDGGGEAHVRSFTETANVTAVAATDDTVWVGTTRGLIRWDLAGKTSTVLGVEEGLPAARISALALDGDSGLYVMTAKGLAYQSGGGWQNFPAVPVGAFVTGLVRGGDGALWAGGPEGLARLKDGKWTSYLGKTSVTALAADGENVWIGTGGRGIARLLPTGKVELYGPDQGCDIDVVRGMAVGPFGMMAIGDAGEGAPRVVLFDGAKFWSYKVDGSGVMLEWIRRVGKDLVVGGGAHAWALTHPTIAETIGVERDGQPAPFSLAGVPQKTARRPPVVGDAAKDLPADSDAGAATGKEPGKQSPPHWEVRAWGPALPDGVTVVGPDGATLLVGTRFLGAERVVPPRVEGGSFAVTQYRTFDLTQNAVRLTVACQGEGEDDCYVATGGARAFHFDGKSFEPFTVDKDPGSRVLAVVHNPAWGVLAVSRGGDPALHLSTGKLGNWTPVGAAQLQVPRGSLADLTFAALAPSGHLWLGLRARSGADDDDGTDFGAAEVSVEDGKVTYHRHFEKGDPPGDARGFELPNDVESACFVGGDEAWFGTHTGAVHFQNGKTRLFTENDGLESEYIRACLVDGDDVWVATSRGVGRFDGARWTFPQEGEPLRVRANSVARTSDGSLLVGTDGGLLVRGKDGVTTIDASAGLIDAKVLDVAVDARSRVWLLTQRGLSILER